MEIAKLALYFVSVLGGLAIAVLVAYHLLWRIVRSSLEARQLLGDFLAFEAERRRARRSIRAADA
jgi:hypothetical protein